MSIQEQNTPPNISSPHSCRICHAEINAPDRRLHSVCLCPDLETRVHYRCLRNSILSFQLTNNHPHRTAGCDVCNTPFNVGPKKGCILNFIENDGVKLYKQLEFYSTQVCWLVSLEVALTTYGMMLLTHVCGQDEAKDIVLSLDPAAAVALCSCIPYCAILVDSAPWEPVLLRGLRRCSSVPIIGTVFPQEFPNEVPENSKKVQIFDFVGGGMLLPIYGKLFGDICFSHVDSVLRRLTFGGMLFIAVRGVMLMYFTQKCYVRANTLSIVTTDYSLGNDS
uniref:E3 ubiquitin-protein ligase MARCHF5 n=1 Tax=Graphocephala atropunctata TaxID=36148 RepID=A0A1B6KWG0_9HEMI